MMSRPKANASADGTNEMTRYIISIIAILAAVLPSPAARTGVRYDFEQCYLVVPGRYMKDRAFIKHDDEWHCFYIVGSDSAIGWQNAGNEITFGHASTTDLQHWAIHPDVLASATGTWDERNIWAPDIIQRNDRFLMYYTGVDSHIVQQMGLAESTDLFEWTYSPLNPLYHPDTSWADWGPGRWSNCRDPDIFRIGDTLHVLNTASTRDGPGAVDHAVSTDGLTWHDRGPLFTNDSDAVTESLQLIEHDGNWYLFFSEYSVLGVSVMRAPSMHGPWHKEDRRVIALGQAAEIFGDVPNTLISRHKAYRDGDTLRYVIKIDSLIWDADGEPQIGSIETFWKNWSPLRLDDPDPVFGETGFEVFGTDSAFACQPTFGENPRLRGEQVTVGFTGDSWIGTRERYRGPLTGTEEGDAVGDEAVGGARSRDFTITGIELTFLIGGGEDIDRLYIALCDAESYNVLLRATGTGSETLEPRSWDIDSLYGRLVYIKLVDASPNGHLNIDDIVERGTRMPPPDEPFPGYVFLPHPNPFSGETTVSLRIDRRSHLLINLFDAAGRRIKRLFSGNAGLGYLRIRWDGTDDRGTTAAPGFYFLLFEAGGGSRSSKIVKTG